MAHTNHTSSEVHNELDKFGDAQAILNLTAKWKDPFHKPRVEDYQLTGGRTIQVVRDDQLSFGTKVRAASAVMSTPEFKKFDTIVYVQPRAGWAGLSLAEICRQTGRRLILFCPASERVSNHQLACKEAGAELRFVRIAAMPVLQNIARKFAHEHGYLFFPLGINVPPAVSGIARVAKSLDLDPPQVWCAISTGVLSRGLQLAWPNADHCGVAVARNLHYGEKGKARIYSSSQPFLQDAKILPPFPSASNYDAKVWEFILNYAVDGAVFWNVAGEKKPYGKQDFQSVRMWNDYSDVDAA